jgi:hypothetical protein
MMPVGMPVPQAAPTQEMAGADPQAAQRRRMLVQMLSQQGGGGGAIGQAMMQAAPMLASAFAPQTGGMKTMVG